jgi:HEAT repeat protein
MIRLGLLVTALLSASSIASLAAQSLARRVESAPDGPVQFTFPARAGVCGNGRTWFSTGPGNIHGSWNETTRAEACESGPVRVVVNRADRVPISARSEGRPGRDALTPAMLGDAPPPTDALLGIARDQSRPRETRRGAISWLGRVSDEEGGTTSRRLTEALLAIARDESDSQPVRKQALSVLARLDRGDGIPALIELSRGASDVWLGKEAMSALARSGDPRARQYLRTAAERTDLPDDVRVSAIRGIGRAYATGQDAEFLRDLYPRLTSSGARTSIISSLAEIGGSENARWLVGIAQREGEPQDIRRRALAGAQKAGASVAELVRLYDGTRDAKLKESLIGIYAQSGERTATDKLISIARTEEDRALRRRAISRLSRSDDPRVKEALAQIVERP